VVTAAGGLAVALVVYLAIIASVERSLLFVVGSGLGLCLSHAAFGFSGGWRRALDEVRTAGLRAQLLLLGLTSLAFTPLLVSGMAVSGSVAPIGVGLLIGAFLFGAGMQLGGGCGSGTLFLAGTGKPRMVVVLVAFIIGSVVGTFHVPWWRAQPALPGFGLIPETGAAGAVAIQLAVLAALAGILVALERRQHGRVEPVFWWPPRGRAGRIFLTGGWPWVWGAVGLALLSVVTLLVKGSPWGITFGFALWGAQGLGALGIDPGRFEYWQWPYPAAALEQGILGNAVSVMNLGLVLGAMMAAGLAGRFRANTRQRLTPGSATSAIIAGFAMGYGARLAFGCNIGAMLGGIASASLHGWVWFAMALLGFAATSQLTGALGSRLADAA
jgi:uncharacterized membrane protein YedE/YeeE